VSTSRQGPVSTKSWIYELHCDTSVFQSETWATCLETTNRSSTAPLSHPPSCTRDTMLYPFIMFVRPLHLDMSCWLTYLESSTLRTSWASIGDTELSGRSSSLSCSSMEIQQTSFKMTILFRYSSYRNYLLRYMYINFLGNRPQADGVKFSTWFLVQVLRVVVFTIDSQIAAGASVCFSSGQLVTFFCVSPHICNMGQGY
jgi:hypothetical protein